MELFYTMNIWFGIVISVIGLIFCLLLVGISIGNKECHTINNFLVCDRCISSCVYFLVYIIGLIYGLNENWSSYQPLCQFRAYLLMIGVSAASYSFLTQAMSRLFFTVFYKHRFLLSWRIHWILILSKWLLSILVSLEPFLFQDGFGLIEEYQFCATTINILWVSFYTVLLAFIFPSVIVIIVYGITLNQVRQSTRRVRPTRTERETTIVHGGFSTVKRNLKVMQQMIILLNILLCGGTPYLILVLWNSIQSQSLPKQFYLISFNLVTLSTTILIIVSFIFNKPVKKIVMKYFFQQ